MNKSNNDIMWDCFTDILNGYRKLTSRTKVMDFLASHKVYKGKEVEYNFSQDNWQLVACWLHFFRSDVKYRVPLLGHHSIHPVWFLRFLFMKYPWLLPVKFIICVEMLLSSTIFARRTNRGALHTSGILLDYYLCYSYRMTWTMKALTWIVERRSWRSWTNIFRTYHNHEGQYNLKVWDAYVENK